MNKILNQDELNYLAVRDYVIKCINKLLPNYDLLTAKEENYYSNNKAGFNLSYKKVIRFLASKTEIFAKTLKRSSDHEYLLEMYYDNNPRFNFMLSVFKEGNVILENKSFKPIKED